MFYLKKSLLAKAGGLLCSFCILVCMAAGCSSKPPAGSGSSAVAEPQSLPVASEVSAVAEPALPAERENDYDAIPLPEEMRGMWISFLEWHNRDIATEEAFRAAVTPMLDNCQNLGLNTVIVAVRAMGDALYESGVFPWSHLITGVQGQAAEYDPLTILTEEAHARGLRLEALVNPYRIQHASVGAPQLAENHAAQQFPEIVREVAGGLYLDPGQPAARQLVVDGVAEIAGKYDVDGIQFDDYFYPEGMDASFDAETYASYGKGQDISMWRRENINSMVRAAYSAVKIINPTVSFGISPQGNNENNFKVQYSDIKLWLSAPGYADYIMPQLYWGFGHVDAAGNTTAAFDQKCAEWAAYPRHEDVRLFVGLAAYRLGLLQKDGTRSEFGGNGFGDQSEWESGHVLADQVTHARDTGGITGFALFRYDFLFQPDDPLTAREIEALQALLPPQTGEAGDEPEQQ